MMSLNCEICGGVIAEDQRAVEIKVGTFWRFFSVVYGGKAVAHEKCIKHEETGKGEITRELMEKISSCEEKGENQR